MLDYREIDERPSTRSRASACTSTSARAARPTSTGAGLLRPGGLFLNHGITRLTRVPSRGPTSSAATCSRTASCTLSTTSSARWRRAGSRFATSSRCASTTPMTLRRWVANLAAHREEVIAEVGEERERVWRLYMLGSAQGFEAGEIAVYQTLAARGARRTRCRSTAASCCAGRALAPASNGTRRVARLRACLASTSPRPSSSTTPTTRRASAPACSASAAARGDRRPAERLRAPAGPGDLPVPLRVRRGGVADRARGQPTLRTPEGEAAGRWDVFFPTGPTARTCVRNETDDRCAC